MSLPSDNIHSVPKRQRRPKREVDPAEVNLDELPKCPNCGYSLYKLTRFRCPECGEPFRPEDFTQSITRQYVDELWRREVRWGRAGLIMLAIGVLELAVGSYWLWPLTGCFIVPLVGTTLLTLLFRRFVGDSLRGALPALGVMWLLVGLYTVLLAI